MLVEGRVALVTGAAGGIGAGIASALARNGAKAVWIVDINEEKAQPTLQGLRPYCECGFIRANVSAEEDVQRVFEKIAKHHDRLDILVNSAGITSVETFDEISIANYDRIMDVNLKGTLLFCRLALQIMLKQKYGRIVNLSSISGQVGGIRTNPAYAASKAGVIALTKSFAKLGAPHGVTVNALAPGIVDTDMTRAPDFIYSVSEVPMGRVGNVEDVADVGLFLCSDMSRYMTGQCLSVNGGMYMN